MIPFQYQMMSAEREEAWGTAEHLLSWFWREESEKPSGKKEQNDPDKL